MSHCKEFTPTGRFSLGLTPSGLWWNIATKDSVVFYIHQPCKNVNLLIVKLSAYICSENLTFILQRRLDSVDMYTTDGTQRGTGSSGTVTSDPKHWPVNNLYLDVGIGVSGHYWSLSVRVISVTLIAII